MNGQRADISWNLVASSTVISVRWSTFSSITLHPAQENAQAISYHHVCPSIAISKYLLCCKAASSLSCCLLMRSDAIWSTFCSIKLHHITTRRGTQNDDNLWTSMYILISSQQHLLICWAESSLSCCLLVSSAPTWSTFCSNRLHASNYYA